jgi:signal transduction histidine kinase
MPEQGSAGDEAGARLLEAARLANVGRLVPSFAHQVSTPLAAIALRAESLERALADPERPAPPDKLRRYLHAIGEETQRCKLLLSTFQEFSRRPEPLPGPVLIQPLCRSAVVLVEHEAMRRQVELRLELADDLPVVRGRTVWLGQALLALLLNAIEASPSGASVRLAAHAAEGEVVLSVSDEGGGVSEQIRARLFEPLASTNAPDAAAGLGLMACRAIAQAHGGSVAWEPLSPRGSRFELRLPASREAKNDGARPD